MTYGLQTYNELGEIAIDSEGGPLLSRVRVGTISANKSASINGNTHYGYDFRTSGPTSLQNNDEVQLIELPNTGDFYSTWGLGVEVIFQNPFTGNTEVYKNKFFRHQYISNMPSLTIHTFRPISSLPEPGAGSYGVSVYNQSGQNIWNTDAILARISNSYYHPTPTSSEAYVTDKVWGDITDPFGLGENLINMNPISLLHTSSNNQSRTLYQAIVAERTSSTNIRLRNKTVDQIDFNAPQSAIFGSIGALSGSG